MPDERTGSSLSRGDFKREHLTENERHHIRNTFGSPVWGEPEPGCGWWTESGSTQLVGDLVGCIGDGKEATVYWCTAGPGLPFDRAAAKVYRAQKFRAFSNASQYLDESRIPDRRTRKALERRTRMGRRIAHALWIDREWNTLCRLYDAGLDVPAPYARSADAILMEFIGEEAGPAPLLQSVRLDGHDARRALEGLLDGIEIMLSCDLVHGDLSPYNVLWWQGRTRIIDLPQAVEATAPDAFTLLDRDIRNICNHFARRGPTPAPGPIADSLWQRWTRGQL